MARKKKIKIRFATVKVAIICVVIVGACFGMCKGIMTFLTKSEYFKVKTIIISHELQFINKKDLARVKGRNIFLIKLKDVQKRLNRKYPQVSDLKLIKHFPDQIVIAAKKRLPFAQARIKSKVFVLDAKGIILSISKKEDKKMPLILGAKASSIVPSLGMPLRSTDMRIALRVLNSFQSRKELTFYFVKSVNVANLSKINFQLKNGLKVIIDKDKIEKNIKILALILSQKQIDFNAVKYIDLRFKEPILGKK